MPTHEEGSLTKEPPLATLDATIRLVRPGMSYDSLLSEARRRTYANAPGLLRRRFLMVDPDDRVVYDRFFSLVRAHGLRAPLVRKVMYFTWAWRDERLRRFVCEEVADSYGRWRVSRLEDISRSSFFIEHWGMADSTARKTRSNLENFFVEAGIYDRNSETIHLELEDGWLAEAMLVAAQYEPDQALRSAMVGDPLGTLFRLGLHPLANVPISQSRELATQPIADLNQLEQDSEAAADHPPPSGKIWQERESKPVSHKSVDTVVNAEALERADASHLLLERLAAGAIRGCGLEPLYSEAIDMYCETPSGTALMEMKSCHAANLHVQVRRGISQLQEYRYRWDSQLGGVTAMALVIEIEPPQKKRWLLDFLESLGIVLAWAQPGSDRLVTRAAVPAAFEGVVEPL